MENGSRQSTSPDEKPPGIPNYRLIKPIGKGGYGTVWLAEETVTGVYRAVKLIRRPDGASKEPDSDKILKAQQRELSGLRDYSQKIQGHPHLLQILTVGETPEYLYYVMETADNAAGATPVSPELYEPMTLATLMKKSGALDPRLGLRICREILLGLEHLHRNGLIHRDVKPANVLLVGNVIKLADIGLVVRQDSDFTRDIGTPGYVPPETHLDLRSDLYAVSMILYEMMTGFDRFRFPELPTDLLKSHRQPWALAEANRIFSRGGHPDPHQRYQSASEFLKAVDAALAAMGSPALGDGRRRKTPLLKHIAIAAGALAAALFLFLYGHGRVGARTRTEAPVPSRSTESTTPSAQMLAATTTVPQLAPPTVDAAIRHVSAPTTMPPGTTAPRILIVRQDGTGDAQRICDAVARCSTSGQDFIIEVADSAIYANEQFYTRMGNPNASLTLRARPGEHPTVEAGDRPGRTSEAQPEFAWTLYARKLRIEGITFRDSRVPPTFQHLMLGLGAEENEVVNCNFSGFGRAICDVYKTCAVRVRDCIFRECLVPVWLFCAGKGDLRGQLDIAHCTFIGKQEPGPRGTPWQLIHGHNDAGGSGVWDISLTKCIVVDVEKSMDFLLPHALGRTHFADNCYFRIKEFEAPASFVDYKSATGDRTSVLADPHLDSEGRLTVRSSGFRPGLPPLFGARR